MKVECEECARLLELLEKLRMRLYETLDEKAHLGSPEVLEAATAFDVLLNHFYRHVWEHGRAGVSANGRLAVPDYSTAESPAARLRTPAN